MSCAWSWLWRSNDGQHQQLLMVDISVSKAGFWPAMQHVKAEGWFSSCHAVITKLLTSYQVMQHAIRQKFGANEGANYVVTLKLSQQEPTVMIWECIPVLYCLQYKEWFGPPWCARQTALERQDLSCTYLAHHELESVFIIIIIITVAQGGGSRVRVQQHQYSAQEKNGLSVSSQNGLWVAHVLILPDCVSFCNTSIHAAIKDSERKCNVV